MSETTGIPVTELLDRFIFFMQIHPEPIKPLTVVPDEPKVIRLSEYTALQLDPDLND